jgi:hypothetical protein
MTLNMQFQFGWVEFIECWRGQAKFTYEKFHSIRLKIHIFLQPTQVAYVSLENFVCILKKIFIN